MEVEVNYLAVILAMASSMVVGSIWYAKPVFGKMWMKLVGLDDAKAAKGAGRAIGITMIVSLITAYVLAHMAYLAHNFFANSFFMDCVVTAFWLWLGFTAARFITHDAFEQRRKKLTAMNVAHEFVTLIIMGVVIGVVGI